MIDFRYHLVSVIAIFLALALGIVVGTTALNGDILDRLRASNKQVIAEKRSLESTVEQLRTEVTRRDDVSAAVAARAVSGRLSGQRVLVVTAPGASTDQVDEVTELVERAGGESGGIVRLRSDLLDPAKGQVLDDLVSSVAPAGLTLPEGSPADRASALLAAGLVRTPGADPLSSDAVGKIVGAFTSADLIDVQGGAGQADRATLAVVIVDDGPRRELDEAAAARQRAELVLARTLDSRSAGVVVAGPVTAAEPGGLLKAVRDDDALSDAVSSVDGWESPTGRVAVILALAEQAAGGAGRYGSGPGAQAGAPRAAAGR